MKAPSGLGARGRRMWRESVAAWSLTPAHLVLLEEGCRLADRLDELDGIIRLVSRGSGGDPDEPVDITKILAEARQQQTALKGIVAELRQGGQRAAESRPEGQGVSDLTARIAARRKSSSG